VEKLTASDPHTSAQACRRCSKERQDFNGLTDQGAQTSWKWVTALIPFLLTRRGKAEAPGETPARP
jgi:hypothetical protein